MNLIRNSRMFELKHVQETSNLRIPLFVDIDLK